jgi:hypothetical protein
MAAKFICLPVGANKFRLWGWALQSGESLISPGFCVDGNAGTGGCAPAFSSGKRASHPRHGGRIICNKRDRTFSFASFLIRIS